MKISSFELSLSEEVIYTQVNYYSDFKHLKKLLGLVFSTQFVSITIDTIPSRVYYKRSIYIEAI